MCYENLPIKQKINEVEYLLTPGGKFHINPMFLVCFMDQLLMLSTFKKYSFIYNFLIFAVNRYTHSHTFYKIISRNTPLSYKNNKQEKIISDQKVVKEKRFPNPTIK